MNYVLLNVLEQPAHLLGQTDTAGAVIFSPYPAAPGSLRCCRCPAAPAPAATAPHLHFVLVVLPAGTVFLAGVRLHANPRRLQWTKHRLKSRHHLLAKLAGPTGIITTCTGASPAAAAAPCHRHAHHDTPDQPGAGPGWSYERTSARLVPVEELNVERLRELRAHVMARTGLYGLPVLIIASIEYVSGTPANRSLGVFRLPTRGSPRSFRMKST